MTRILFRTLAAAAVATFIVAPAVAQNQPQPSREERMQHWAADHETMFRARLAGMKSGLSLTADQEKFWNPFESAIEDAFKSRMDTMQTMMKMRQGHEPMSPVDRMEFMADRMAKRAAAMKAISEAAKPLYGSLDANQKHTFEVLGRDMMMSAHAPLESAEGYYSETGFSWEPEGWWGMMEAH